MLKELSILELFFQDPIKTYSAREISRACGVSHITVAKKLKAYRFIERASYGPYEGFKAIMNPEFNHLRFVRNYLMLQESGLLEYLIKIYSQPTIILFGSYATATQAPNSDIDILVIAEKKTEVPLTDYETKLGHKIHLFVHNRSDIRRLSKESPYLVNGWCNGLVLNGELEVLGK